MENFKFYFFYMDLRKCIKSVYWQHFCLLIVLVFVRESKQTCFRQLFAIGTRVVFQFQCYPPNGVIPLIPTGDTSSPANFNELILSPNFFVNITTPDLCQFTNLITLDISFNLLVTSSGLFGAFECMSKLQTLKANNNFISTPLMGTHNMRLHNNLLTLLIKFKKFSFQAMILAT